MSSIEDTEYKISIDTIHLVAKLDQEQRQIIYDRFRYTKNRPDWHWWWSQTGTKPLGFSLHALPTNTYLSRHYNHQLQLQQQVLVQHKIPQSLAEIIHGIDWNIKRIDISFDLKIDKAKSMFFQHNGNVRHQDDSEWNTEYLSKLTTRSVSRLASYERNVKEENNNTGTIHEFQNRYEVRIYPASNNESMKLHSMQDDFIVKNLSKYIILPDINRLPISKWDKNRLYKIKHDYSYLKTLDKKVQRELRVVAKQHRLPLEQIYLDNKPNLFQFLQEPVVSQQTSQEPMHQVV